MERGNVLVIGNSGVGKSTLINAVLGKECAVTNFGGTTGTTKELTIYESESVPFRIIDTVGFEPSWIKEFRAINAVKKWSKESTQEGKEDIRINVIWFCVDGTSSKLFPETIKNLMKATKMYASVPVIAVITKAYGVPDRKKNIEMVYNAFATQKKYANNLKKVIPVVAASYVLREGMQVAPEGIGQLIDATNDLLPEGIRAADRDITNFKMKRRKSLAQGTVAIAVTSAVTVGFVPIPFSDAAILGPVEAAEINALAKIYGIDKNEESNAFISSIIEVGTVSVTAKAAISALKAIPGINIGVSLLNAIVAGSIVAALGEGTIYAFEQVCLGKKSLEDVDWLKKMMESRLTNQFIERVKNILEGAKGKEMGDIINMIMGTLIDGDYKKGFKLAKGQ